MRLAGNNGAASTAATEIVVTRERHRLRHPSSPNLREIEEIRINGVDPSGTAGTAGRRHLPVIGDFSGTSLRLNTITIDGDAGDDTIDISALTSAHRIVFRSNGGNDTIIGTLRPQDVIELPDGATAADYTSRLTDERRDDYDQRRRSITFSFTAVGSGRRRCDGDDDDEPMTPTTARHDTAGPDATTGAPIVGTAEPTCCSAPQAEKSIAHGGNDVASAVPAATSCAAMTVTTSQWRPTT